MNRPIVLSSARFASLALLTAIAVAGCHGNSSTSAQFAPSNTAATPGLVKLMQKSRSGSRVVLDVVIFGPEPALDLSGFKFAVKIGDPSLAQLAMQTTCSQNALVAGDGQAITVEVDGASDPSLIQVTTAKQGGGPGNGIAGGSAVVIELPLDVQGSGATSLTLVGIGDQPPQAIDSTRNSIPAVTFDDASATVRGVTTGGGY